MKGIARTAVPVRSRFRDLASECLGMSLMVAAKLGYSAAAVLGLAPALLWGEASADSMRFIVRRVRPCPHSA